MNETPLARLQVRFQDLVEEARLTPLTDDARDTLIKVVKAEAELLAFGPYPEAAPPERAAAWWDR